MSDKALTIAQVTKNDQALWDLFESVPFGNSLFQTKAFVTNGLHAGRSRRQVLLELHDRAAALNKAGAERDRKSIFINRKKREIAEKQEEYKQTGRDRIAEDILLLEADIRELEFELKSQEKLAEDAMQVVHCLLETLAKLPPYTREQFEAEEATYWKDKLILDARNQILQTGRVAAGTFEALHQLGIPPAQAHAEITAELDNDVEAEKKKLSPPKA